MSDDDKKRRLKGEFTDDSLNKKTDLGEKIFKLSFFIAIIAILFFSGKAIVGYTRNEIKKSENIDTGLVSVPNIIGLDIENAKEMLSQIDIKTQIQYSDNDFFDIDAVMKMSVDPGKIIERGSTVIVYVAKKDNIEAVKSGSHYYKDIYTEELPVRKNQVVVKKIFVEDNQAVFIMNNDSNSTLNAIKLTVGYIDASGDKFLNKPTIVNDINVEPFKDFKIKQTLKNPKIKGLTIETIETVKEKQAEKEEGDKN